jgi:hypothetical protein
MNRLAITLSLTLFVSPVLAQEANPDDTMKNCPMHQQHASQQSHHAIVESHGDQAMGFPHDKTTHHFRIMSDGGTIEVTVNDADDKANTGAIRSHLSHIATMFGSGDFSTSMFIHDGVPPGVTTMKLMKSAIHSLYAVRSVPKLRHLFARFLREEQVGRGTGACSNLGCCERGCSGLGAAYRRAETATPSHNF